MKHFGRFALLSAVLASASSATFAAPVSAHTLLTGGLTVNGVGATQDSFTPTSITFPGITPNAIVSGGYGNLIAYAGDKATMSDFTNTTTNQTILSVVSSKNLTFELLSVVTFTDIYTPGFGAALIVNGTGEFFDTNGDTPEIGTFILSSNGVSCTSTDCGSGNIGFSFTPAAAVSTTPEPNSLILLGTGLVGVAGTLFRRRRTV